MTASNMIKPCCCCCCCHCHCRLLLRDIVVQVFASLPISAFCLTIRAVRSSETTKTLSTTTVDAGLTTAAIHVGRIPGLDATEPGGSDTATADDATLSKAVAQFYTGAQKVSGPAKVFHTTCTVILFTPTTTQLHSSTVIV